MVKEGFKSSRVAEYCPAASCEEVTFAKKGRCDLVVPGLPDSLVLYWIITSQKMGYVSAKLPDVNMKFLQMRSRPVDID